MDLPGFRSLEDKVMLWGTPREIDVDDLSRLTFGITKGETYNLKHGFVVDRLRDDEAVDKLKSFGFDFTGETGQPLRCTSLFSRQAEAAARRLAGDMPERSSLGVEKWGSVLEAELRAFMAGKRSR